MVIYNLGINKISGTMTSWFNTKGQGSRIIFVNEGASQLFNVYIDANQKVNLAVVKWKFDGLCSLKYCFAFSSY